MAKQTEVAAAIRRYQAAQLGPSGESSDKVEAVLDLEPHLAHPAAEAFLVSLLRDHDEYDLARVEVCKALRASLSGALSRGYAEALLQVLQTEDDILVRQWAALGLLPFRHLPEVVQALVITVADSREDADVRHNALASLRGATICQTDRAFLERVVSDNGIGVEVAKLLRDSAQ
jgi:hypothetical protein